MDVAQLAVAGLCLLASSLFWSESFEPDQVIRLNSYQRRVLLREYYTAKQGSAKYEALEEVLSENLVRLPKSSPDSALAEIVRKLD